MKKKHPPESSRLSPELALAAARLADGARGPLLGLQCAATQVEELLGRGEGGFLAGNLLAVVNGAFQEMRGEIAQDISSLARFGLAGKRPPDPFDVVDQADFYASTVGELAALLKLLAEVELDEQPDLRSEWERLSEQLLADAAGLQRAVEEFESALEAAEPEEAGRAEAGAASGPLVSAQLLGAIWEQAKAGEPLAGEEARLAQVMQAHPEYHAVFDQADRLDEAASMVDGVNPFAHVAMHTAVEAQLETGDPPETRAALARLTASGLDRHEAVHRIGTVLSRELYEILRDGRPFDRPGYTRRLKELNH